MVISSRYRLVSVLVLTTLTVGGCQNAVDVGAVNRCGVDVEVKMDTIRDGSTRWITVHAGDRENVVAIGENSETLYVEVRPAGGQPTRTFDVPTKSLGRPPAGVDYEAELVLEGERCP
jgi:hydrogenase maturation factor